MFESINPYNQQVIARYNEEDRDNYLNKVRIAHKTQQTWAKTALAKRAEMLHKLADSLKNNERHFGVLITSEMGKPIAESQAEIDKCVWLCRYCADNLRKALKDISVKTDAQKSFCRYRPLGVVLGVMPWNFPAWQVMRMAVPAIAAGNTVLVKHASNVIGCGEMLEKVFREAGFETGVFQNLRIRSVEVSHLISDDRIKGVSLTGSVKAGSAVARLAGKHLKPSVMELGGSNAFVVLEDADLDLAVDKCVTGRFLNAGQSCIAAKRIFVQDGVYDDFLRRFTEKAALLKVADPVLPSTKIGPLARVDLAEELERQLSASVKMGAEVVLGGHRSGACFDPTVVTSVTPEMPLMCEEIFGPVAPLVRFSTLKQALKLVGDSEFGLGAAFFTSKPKEVLRKAKLLEEGSLFFNEIVKSDPRLPFGGVKKSGYGRELAFEGIRAFTNVQTVYIA